MVKKWEGVEERKSSTYKILKKNVAFTFTVFKKLYIFGQAF